MATVTFGFSAQSDEARHMTLGLKCIKFMLEQDPANLPIVQAGSTSGSGAASACSGWSAP
jgi:hypothetical protein